MNGEQLYAAYCAELNERWPASTHAFWVSTSTHRAPAEPKAWAFLTKIEKDAWWALAERQGAAW